jgi:hypothetical protein
LGLLNTIEQVDELDVLDSDLGGRLNQYVERFRKRVEARITNGTDSETMVPAVFLDRLVEWCTENPETPARLLSVSFWDDSANGSSEDESEAERIHRIVADELNYPPSTRLGSETLVFFVGASANDSLENDFDWASQLEALRTELSTEDAAGLEVSLESAKWPRDATGARSLLDAGTPSGLGVRQSLRALDESAGFFSLRSSQENYFAKLEGTVLRVLKKALDRSSESLSKPETKQS